MVLDILISTMYGGAGSLRNNVDSIPEEIIVRMVKQFHTVFNNFIIERAREIGMTVHEVVTLASLIETEACIDMERPIISQVFTGG